MKERRNTREEMTTDGIYAKIKDGSCHSDDLLTRKPILRTVVSQEDDTEESSDDDDISYGSDGSSIDGDFNDDFRCSLTDEDSMFSDEEVFSEEEDEYDLGTREVRTYELYDCFKPCRDFDEPLYTAEATGVSTLNLLEAIRSVDKSIRFYQASTSEMFGASPPPQNTISGAASAAPSPPRSSPHSSPSPRR